MNKQVKAIQAEDLTLGAAKTSERWGGLWQNLSIQQRLPFYIFILLIVVVGAFSWISYLSVRKAGMSAGDDRVTALADKLSLMFKSSVDRFAASAKQLSAEENVRRYFITQQKDAYPGALSSVNEFLHKDTTNKAVDFFDAHAKEILHAGVSKLQIDPAAQSNKLSVGKIIDHGGNLYFPVFAQVTDGGKIIGYVVNWKHIYASREAIDQFGQLLGNNGKLYIGNDDGRFWTDLLKPSEGPPVGLDDLRKVAEYNRTESGDRLGSVRNIPDSKWLLLIELSGKSFLAASKDFLRWVTVIGMALIAAGSFGGWLLSRSITRPLAALDNAASAMAAGDYAVEVPVHSKDELGRLAESFNTMTRQVQAAQRGLEQQVHETSKELETAITDIQEQKEIDKKKDEFISLASHELKTPLTTIKAFFQIAINDIPSDARSFRLVNKASRQVVRMERLISDLLDVSRINTGQMTFNPEPFDFGMLLTETVETMREIYPDRNLVIEKSVTVPIIADRQRIEQVITNLLNNAVKYSQPGDNVLIRCEHDNANLFFTIQDFGIGIDEKKIGELFKRFNRIDENHRFQGLGLGLFISDEIIKRHGGRISVKSALGEGSSFTVQLPLDHPMTVEP